MKVYLDDEKTHVDPCPHNGIQCGLDSNDRDHCVTSSVTFLKKQDLKCFL